MAKIVVAGAGFGGIRAALDLYRYLPNDKITIINSTPYHCYHADLYEVAAAILDKENKIDFKNLSGTANIPLKNIFQKKEGLISNIEVLIDTINEIDLTKNNLSTETIKNIDFDFLILALGSKTNHYNIKGAEEFSHPLKTTEDALNIRNDIEELMIRNDKSVSVVVAGGGYTGVELAGQLAYFIKDLGIKYQNPQAKICILEASDTVLPGMPKWAQHVALKKLKELGAEILLNHMITKVDKDKIYTKQNNISYNYLIWTTGVTCQNLEGKIKGISFTDQKKLEVKPNLSLGNYPNVYVVGDLVQFQYKKSDKMVPATAWAAIEQAKVAAKNVQANAKGKPTTIIYNPSESVFVVPIGARYAISNYANIKIIGVLGWFLKRMIALKYFLSILPFSEALAVWRKGVNIYSNV